NVLAVARSVVQKNGLTELYPRLANIGTKDARQAWIGHAFVRSGYDVLLARLAGGHGSLRSTRHYLRSHRYRMHSEAEVRKLQNAIFSEVDGGRVLDPSRLRLLGAN